ncbi:MAG: CvpA family protein [Phycisphaerales bacterium]|jgi:hypothetical protein|nr:CvpA family protein [Phycisphaerales bacterium]
MVIQILAILVFLGVAYVWSARGFFTSLLNLGVTIASGAIAFGLWEWSERTLLGLSDSRLLSDLAPGLGLALPFALSLVILTVIVSVLLRSNTRLDAWADWTGGIICGLVSGIIVAGITMISTQSVRMNPDALEFQGAASANTGSVVRDTNLWLPVDRMTVGIYAFLSNNTLATSTPLGVWRPHAAEEGPMRRLGPSGFLLRNALRNDEVSLLGRYTVGRGKNIPIAQLVGDAKPVQSVDGATISGNAYIEGFLLEFTAAAREKTGQVIASPGQITLVARRPDGLGSIALSPFAMVSQAKGDALQVGRWRFDARDVYIAAPGADAKPKFAFEFLVPADHTPMAIYVRGVRFDIATVNSDRSVSLMNSMADVEDIGTYTTAITRNRFDRILGRETDEGTGRVRGGFIRNPKGVSSLTVTAPQGGGDPQVRIANTLPGGVFLDSSFMSGVDLTEKGNGIRKGRIRLKRENLSPAGAEQSVRVEAFDPGTGTAIVFINISRSSPVSPVQPSVSDVTGAPFLVDTNGQRYPAIGYVFRTANEFEVSFDAQSPISNIIGRDVPSVSRSVEGQDLFLVFRVNIGVSINYYAIGDTIVGEISPPQRAAQQTLRGG